MKSEQYKLECLARFLLNEMTLNRRRVFLFNYEKRHGIESVEKLKRHLTIQNSRMKELNKTESTMQLNADQVGLMKELVSN